MLEVSVQCKHYAAGVQALATVQFACLAGERLALVGPSGAGKTTLLRIVAGLERDYEGHVKRPSGRMAYVFQEPRLLPWLSVFDNLALVLERQPDTVDRCRSLLAEVGLLEFSHCYPAQLSGGMQRRLALARAFVVEPALLLMDEPFVSLDAPTTASLYQLLLRLWRQHKPTMLLVTHRLSEAVRLMDRLLFFSARPGCIVLEERVEMTGSPGDEEQHIRRWEERLLQRHPDLLSGSVAAGGDLE